ncbi:Crp/Fnr family transcriptional regulator [Spirillospora sp. NPDC048911]|uniref:Crp/Fnr family transcriptional regulator n=1 Tax=Spirillospora sp. NPDC048911 TaxID=3364527 RepID=UPI00371E291A
MPTATGPDGSTGTGPDPRRNRLLAGLPAKVYQRVVPDLEQFHAGMRHEVYGPGQPIEHVYFPLYSVFSLVAEADGKAVEVATIGHEGMVGLPVFLGAATSPNRAFCQIPGPTLRMTAAQLRRLLQDNGVLHTALHHYTQATLVQLAQSVACNRLHDNAQRMSRWILTTHDRMDTDRFTLTHEFLAQMLGVRRATVSEHAANLQRQGLITYSRGAMTITDRRGLEGNTCECYHIVRTEFDALLGRDRLTPSS